MIEYVQVEVVVTVYTDEYPGFCIYVAFCDIVEPHVETLKNQAIFVKQFIKLNQNNCFQISAYLKVQQTPKPEAQLPSAVPLFELHSVELRQTP